MTDSTAKSEDQSLQNQRPNYAQLVQVLLQSCDEEQAIDQHWKTQHSHLQVELLDWHETREQTTTPKLN